MQDHFLKLSIFPNSDSLYYRNLHEILGSLVFYIVLYQYVSDWIIKMLFFTKPEHLKTIYSKKNFKEYLNFKIHIVAMFQCIISILMVSKNLFKQSVSLDISTYQDDYSTMVSSFTIGYFLWDLYICLRWVKLFHMEFLIHAAASLFVFVASLRPFCQGWVSKFLLFELSSPFVNINWFISNILIKMLNINNVPTFFNVANGLCLIATFATVRIGWGYCAVVIMAFQIWHKGMYQKPEFSFSLISIIFLINIALNCLNIIWLGKMINIAKKMMSPSKTQKHK